MADIICDVNESVEYSLQNMPRVYFCCHPDDFEEYYVRTKMELHNIYPNISFWYYKKSDEPDAEVVNQMNLMVIIVTNKFLEEYQSASYSCYKALKQASAIPRLPLVQEGVAEESYKMVFGHSQYLSKENGGAFAVPYEEKLKKRLSETLLNDESRKRVEDAFVASVFLSYRKKDRKFVQRIMELIHSSEKYWDVGIWYDEFLTPGEAFDEEIESVLINSDLFVLMVTSNLLEKDNYVIKAEYPKAVDCDLPILSIECAQTDKDAFRDIFGNVNDIYSVDDIEHISGRIDEVLKGKEINSDEDDSVHMYLLGMAYLHGLKVEKDGDRAIALLNQAADLGCAEAYERLAIIYHNGDGVEADPEREIYWRRKYVEWLKEGSADESYKIKLLQEMVKLAECILGRVRYDEAKEVYEEALILLKQLKDAGNNDAEAYEYQVYSELGDSIRLKAADMKKVLTDAEVQEAKDCYIRALEKCGEDLHRQVAQYSNLGGLLYQLAETIIVEETDERDKGIRLLKDAKGYCEKAFEILENLEKNSPSYEKRRTRSVLSDKMAGIYRLEENFEEALKYFKVSLEIWEKFKDDYPSGYHEEGYVLARYNYAEVLYRMGKEDAAERELIWTAKLIGRLKDKKKGLTGVGILVGYKANYLLTIIYKAHKDDKKVRDYYNTMKKYEAGLSRLL